jgi:uncharacterized RDD family membrane protein YckC
MQGDPGLRIQTSDNVGIGFDVARLGSRALALLLDLLVLAIPEGILLTIATGYFMAAVSSGGSDQGQLGRVMIFAAVFMFLAYFMVLEATMNGTTPGKRALNLRVVRLDGRSIGVAEAILRNVLRLVDILLWIGVLPMFFNRYSRRFGDLAAGTMVIREHPRHAMSMAVVPAFVRRADPGPPLPGLDNLGHHEHSLLRSYLGRYDLVPAHRARLAGQMGAVLAGRMNLAPDAPERALPPDDFVERVFLQLRERLGAT